MRKAIVSVLLVMVSMVWATAGFCASVKIGVVGPLTGPVAAAGLDIKNAIELAADEINAGGGIPGVGPIELFFEDDKCTPPDSVAAVNKLVHRDKVLCLIGSVCSSATLAGMVVSEKAQTPQLTTMSTSPAITQKGNKWIFRTAVADTVRAEALADFAIKELKSRNVAIIHDNDDYGRDGAVAFTDRLKTHGITPKVVEAFNRKDKDFTSQLAKAKEAEADLLVVWALLEESSLIVKQARAMNLKAHIGGGDPMAHPRFRELAEGAAEGVFSTVVFLRTDPSPKVQAFVKAYEEKFGKEVDAVPAANYDGLNLLAQAIEKSGADKAKLREALLSIQFSGVTGDLGFDETGECVANPFVVQIQDGKLVKYQP